MKYFKVWIIMLLPVSLLGQAAFVSFLPVSQWEQKGAFFEVSLYFEVEQGYHIQADAAQIQNEYLIPSAVLIDASESFSICEIHFPQAHIMLLGGTDSIRVWDGRFEIRLMVEFKENSFPEGLSGKLTYQACDDKKCFFPRELAFVANDKKALGQLR